MAAGRVKSVKYSGLYPVAQEFAVAAEAVLGPREAILPSADAAILGILVAALFPVAGVAWDLAGLAATVVYPFQVVESVWAAFGPAVAVGCCQPSTALVAECWVARR